MGSNRRGGFTLLEILIVVAIVGVVGAISFVSLPRDRYAVGQAAQITSQAVRLARLEAVKRDTDVSVNFVKDSSSFDVVRDDTSTLLHTYSLDPQGAKTVTVTSGTDSITFNPRGVTSKPTSQPVVLTNTKTGYSKTLSIDLQGNVEIQ